MRVSKFVHRRPQVLQQDLCTIFYSLCISARKLSTTSHNRAAGRSNNATPNPMHSAPPQTTPRGQNAASMKANNPKVTNPVQPSLIDMTPAQRLADTERRIKEATIAQTVQQQAQSQKRGGLAPDSIFADEHLPQDMKTEEEEQEEQDAENRKQRLMSDRSPSNMAPRLNPNPDARARWQRMMVIRHIRHKGRLTRDMRIARSERSHLSRSPFFNTSIKKLMPLARQIAGKSIDDAILQMRFSKKKAALEVQKHLIQARNEAIVMRGMGLPAEVESATENQLDAQDQTDQQLKSAPLPEVRDTIKLIHNAIQMSKMTAPMKTDKNGVTSSTQPANNLTTSGSLPSTTMMTTTLTSSSPVDERATPTILSAADTPPTPFQRPQKTLRHGIDPHPHDIYIAEAWVNRGKYGQTPSARARGRTDIERNPHTGITVVLKEEKTRTREAQEKHMKTVRKRLNGRVWEGLPDRKVSRQSQYVLW